MNIKALLNKFFLLIVILIIPQLAKSQAPKRYSASEIQLKLRKLNVLGTALYVAAHPDDENTRMITYLSYDRLVNTAYLSVTRGDGGQNLIGPEIREMLGIIRTQELMAARRLDEGQQFFTRANDFGYSKSAEETLEIWDKEKLLYDVVWAIRQFRPDVIITRFPPDKRARHGQHTTSAILAEEAFDLVGNPKNFPEQLKYVDVWQPKRLLLNTGRWWNDSISAEDEGVVTLDVGTYNALLGKSYNEIAAFSRSQHKSQGFGATGSRGSQIEFLEIKKGDAPENDLFEGIDVSWNRVKGGNKIKPMVENIIAKFNPATPGDIVPDLVELRRNIISLEDKFWRKRKLTEVDGLIKACLGLFLEVRAHDHSLTPADSLKLKFEAINRSSVSVKLNKVLVGEWGMDTVLNTELQDNKRLTFELKSILPSDLEYSQPYWLKNGSTLGMYGVDDIMNIGKPENNPSITTIFELQISGEDLKYSIPIVYKWNDPVKGEQYRPIAITPPVFVNIERQVYMFPDDKKKSIQVLVKSGKENIHGELSLNIPDGWKIQPESMIFHLEKKGQEKSFTFELFPPKNQQSVEITARAQIDNLTFEHSLINISYDHIPTQTLFPKATTKAVKLNLKKKGKNLGYVMGTGDAIPESLEQIGYQVWNMRDDEVTADNLKDLDAVILGVRALNTNERIRFHMPLLLDYVKNGGNLIVQYNTFFRLKTKEFSPYHLKISRDRVAEEKAEIRILLPDHEVLNSPNKITRADFEGWVQERGLYFPNEWADEFKAVLSSNDTNEDPKDGGLLVAKYGEGYYIYSGYSWFRELPAGVPGAYRLFTNMISLGQKEVTDKVDLGRSNK